KTVISFIIPVMLISILPLAGSGWTIDSISAGILLIFPCSPRSPCSSDSGPPVWDNPQVVSNPPPKVLNRSTPRLEKGCGAFTPPWLSQTKLCWLKCASAMSIPRSITTLYLNPVPVLIHAIRVPLPRPLSSTEVSMPPHWAAWEILSFQERLLLKGISCIIFRLFWYSLVYNNVVSVMNCDGAYEDTGTSNAPVGVSTDCSYKLLTIIVS